MIKKLDYDNYELADKTKSTGESVQHNTSKIKEKTERNDLSKKDQTYWLQRRANRGSDTTGTDAC